MPAPHLDISPFVFDWAIGNLAFAAVCFVVCLYCRWYCQRWLEVSPATPPGIVANLFRRLLTLTLGSLTELQDKNHWPCINDGIFKLVETIKLVAIFLMMLNPMSLVDYRCSIPAGITGEQLSGNAYFFLYDIPCTDSKYSIHRTGYLQDFLISRNLNETQQATMIELQEWFCPRKHSGKYLGAMLAFEMTAFLFLTMMHSRLFEFSRFLVVLFALNAVAWIGWSFFFMFKFDNDKSVCEVFFMEVATGLFCMWHFFVAVVLYLGRTVHVAAFKLLHRNLEISLLDLKSRSISLPAGLKAYK